MWNSFLAELHKSVRRGANWLMLAIAVTLAVSFGYLVPYTGYLNDSDAPAQAVLGLLPSELVGNSIGGAPFFLGAIGLIIGALAVGGEYAWGTWKTVLTQGPSRMTVFGMKLAALAATTLTVVLAVFMCGGLAAFTIAGIEDLDTTLPSLGELAVGVGAGWLIVTMWSMLGALLAVLTRGVAVPIGVGLVWMLAVQNLLASIAAPLLDWVAEAQRWLPGPNAGSLVAALGSSERTPGVEDLVSTPHAVTVLVSYLLIFGCAAAVTLRRRDLV